MVGVRRILIPLVPTCDTLLLKSSRHFLTVFGLNLVHLHWKSLHRFLTILWFKSGPFALEVLTPILDWF